MVFRLQEREVLIGELPLSEQLENTCAQRCLQVHGWDIILAYLYFILKSRFQLLLLASRVLLVEMNLLRVGLGRDRCPA